MLTDTEIIARLGGTYAVAKMFNIKPPSVSAWKANGIPAARRMYLKLAQPHLFGAAVPEQEATTRPAQPQEFGA